MLSLAIKLNDYKKEPLDNAFKNIPVTSIPVVTTTITHSSNGELPLSKNSLILSAKFVSGNLNFLSPLIELMGTIKLFSSVSHN